MCVRTYATAVPTTAAVTALHTTSATTTTTHAITAAHCSTKVGRPLVKTRKPNQQHHHCHHDSLLQLRTYVLLLLLAATRPFPPLLPITATTTYDLCDHNDYATAVPTTTVDTALHTTCATTTTTHAMTDGIALRMQGGRRSRPESPTNGTTTASTTPTTTAPTTIPAQNARAAERAFSCTLQQPKHRGSVPGPRRGRCLKTGRSPCGKTRARPKPVWRLPPSSLVNG